MLFSFFTGSFTSLLLDPAKAMGFDQLQVARAKRAEKAAEAAEGKAKQGRKGKVATEGEDPKAEVASCDDGQIQVRWRQQGELL
jgi:hypothetical protein